GQWIDLFTPGSEQAGIALKADCAVVLFDLQGRQVAGFVSRQGAACSDPRYPGQQTLARLVKVRNEVWESPVRPAPPWPTTVRAVTAGTRLVFDVRTALPGRASP